MLKAIILKRMSSNNFKTFQRNCNNCTKCCEGWLSGEVNGYSFYPGRPCHFMKCDGCSIYILGLSESRVIFSRSDETQPLK